MNKIGKRILAAAVASSVLVTPVLQIHLLTI